MQSRKVIFPSGSVLKMMLNKSVMIMNTMNVLKVKNKNTASCLKVIAKCLLRISIKAFIIKLTYNKNHTEPIMENDMRRLYKNFIKPRLGFALMPQI